MAEFITTRCSEKHHPEVCLSVDEDSDLSPDWLLEYFTAEVTRGVRFEAGQTVQIGWILVQLNFADNGVLEIWEPDFDSFPIRWHRGANNVLRHMIIQRSICEALGCEPLFPSLRHAGIISPRFSQSQEFTMSRDQPVDSDSGWVFAEVDYAGSEGEFRSLYQIALDNMRIIPFLALPMGASITIRLCEIKVCLGSKQITSKNNELLGQLLDDPILL